MDAVSSLCDFHGGFTPQASFLSIKNPVHGLEKALGSVHSLNGIQPLSDEYLYLKNYSL